MVCCLIQEMAPPVIKQYSQGAVAWSQDTFIWGRDGSRTQVKQVRIFPQHSTTRLPWLGLPLYYWHLRIHNYCFVLPHDDMMMMKLNEEEENEWALIFFHSLLVSSWWNDNEASTHSLIHSLVFHFYRFVSQGRATTSERESVHNQVKEAAGCTLYSACVCVSVLHPFIHPSLFKCSCFTYRDLRK